MNANELINQRKASEILGIDHRTVAKLAVEQELQYIKRGNQKLYKTGDILTLKNSGEPVTQIKVFMVGSPKGGTGKTTTTKYLSKLLANSGKKVLVIDADPQHYYTDFVTSGWDPTEKEKVKTSNLHSFLLGKKKSVTLPAFHNIDFIAGIRLLEHYEKELSNILGSELLMKRIIAPLLPKYDYIIIDSSPSQNAVTMAALISCNVLIIPIMPDIDSFEAANDLVRSIVTILDSELSDKFKLRKIIILPVRQKDGFGKESKLSKQIRKDIQEAFTLSDLELNIEIDILEPIMDHKDIPLESYEGILREDTKAFQNYKNVFSEVI